LVGNKYCCEIQSEKSDQIQDGVWKQDSGEIFSPKKVAEFCTQNDKDKESGTDVESATGEISSEDDKLDQQLCRPSNSKMELR